MCFHLFVFVLGVEVPIRDYLVPFRRTKSGRSMRCCTLEVWWKRIDFVCGCFWRPFVPRPSLFTNLPRSWFLRFFCLVLRYISFSRSFSVDSSWECRVPWRDVLSVGVDGIVSWFGFGKDYYKTHRISNNETLYIIYRL